MVAVKKFCIIVAVLTLTNCFSVVHLKDFPEDAYLDFAELSTKYGHPVKRYEVITEDGYILTLFNLPGTGPPILLIHGIMNSADSFVIRGNTSLAITLANTNYDVWVGSTRGTKYTLNHTTLNSDIDKQFWDFSFHEGGLYDLPAMIDFVLNATGKESLTTVGHSQGSTIHFVMGSERPEYNSKINLFIALAPVVFLNYIEAPVTTLVEVGPFLDTYFKSAGIEAFTEEHSLLKKLIKSICTLKTIGYELCIEEGLFSIGGEDTNNFEPEFLPVLIKYYPTSTSRKSAHHYIQLGQRRSFNKYDYGSVENLMEYGQSSPPNYDLSKVTMNVAIIVGRNDAFATLKDIDLLNDSLPNVVDCYIVETEQWNHFSNVFGLHMPQYLYPHIFRLLKKYN